jgi:transcription elongation factor GreA
MNDTLITQDGLDRLNAELEQLHAARRAEADAAREEVLLARRIAVLEQRLAEATLAEPDDRNGVVDVGERVTVRNRDTGELHEYRLVGTLESAPGDGLISVLSPLGRALLGRRVGEIASVSAPRGTLRFEVVSIDAACAA